MIPESYTLEHIVLLSKKIEDSVHKGKLTLLIPSVLGDCNVREMPLVGHHYNCPIERKLPGQICRE